MIEKESQEKKNCFYNPKKKRIIVFEFLTFIKKLHVFDYLPNY